MSSFHESLEVGKKSEELVLNRIKNKYPSAYIKDGYFKEFDIFIPEIDTSVEVKKDFMSKYTGNVVVEVQMNGKLSALSTTKADWWVFHLDEEEFIFITPEPISTLIPSGIVLSNSPLGPETLTKLLLKVTFISSVNVISLFPILDILSP